MAFGMETNRSQWGVIPQLAYHKEQRALWECTETLIVASCGRRTGKTLIECLRLVSRAIRYCGRERGRFFCCAPTHKQAKDIFFELLRSLIPRFAYQHQDPRRGIYYGERRFALLNADIWVVGLDVPQRTEGGWLHGAILDEFGNSKAGLLQENLLPMLADDGWISIIGTPEGKNHYFDLVQDVRDGRYENAAHFTWTAEEVMRLYRKDAEAVFRQARSQMSPEVYAQEFLGEFISYGNIAAHNFRRDVHTKEELRYDDAWPLYVGLDFNCAPGIAILAQELTVQSSNPQVNRHLQAVTCVIDEIWIERASTTKRVCQEIIDRWGHHKRDIVFYGDSSGGAAGSAKTEGSDWDICEKYLRPTFGHQLDFDVPPSNPRERSRLNSLNSRLEAADGTISLLIDKRCHHLIRDMESVSLDSKGAIDKANIQLTHALDGLSYMIHRRHPITEYEFSMEQV